LVTAGWIIQRDLRRDYYTTHGAAVVRFSTLRASRPTGSARSARTLPRSGSAAETRRRARSTTPRTSPVTTSSASRAIGSSTTRHGANVRFHVWPGGHDFGYWNAHIRAYLRFYARALAAC
jgi:enterochelin esterase-like enzyme